MINEYKKGLATKISENFLSTEFDCKCKSSSCKVTYIDSDLIKILEKIRKEFKSSICITSGFRCVSHNKSQKGKKGSYHLIGKACDFVVVGVPQSCVQKTCEPLLEKGGLGKASNFTHIDVRGCKSRWRY